MSCEERNYSNMDSGISVTLNVPSSRSTLESIEMTDILCMTDERKLDYIRQLGEGSFGKVIAVKHQKDGKNYAVKLMRCTSNVREKYQLRELKLLTEQVDSPTTHENIVKYYDSWEYQSKTFSLVFSRILCIRMELCDMSLEEFLQKKSNLVDQPSFYCHVFPQILRGLKYIHAKHWVHRDLYPPNVLMKFCDDVLSNCVVKLADFGLARKLEEPSITVSDPPEEVLTVVGNKLYRAPEMSCEMYDYKVDMFSAGLVLYRICRYSKHNIEIIEELERIRGTKMVDKTLLCHHGDLLYGLLDGLINWDPEKRLSASQALNLFTAQHDGYAKTDGSNMPSPTHGVKVFARYVSEKKCSRIHQPFHDYDTLVECLKDRLEITDNDMECCEIIEESNYQRVENNEDVKALLLSCETKHSELKLVVEHRELDSSLC